MAGQRKLLSEIDRTLKKVAEGVDVFNEIWDKVYAATAQNQKEKHEADLKKEIKKLQRFRDQIKNWISGSDVKDKRPLIEARKLIEQKMEEFKVCEKETKTKAYSKEGLAQVEKLDPAEQARQATKGWILDALAQFNEQIESFECDLERMAQSKGRNRNRAEKENLEALLARHKWHILKLEQINRLLDNHALEPGEVDDIKDDIDYYLEANQEEPDFLDTYDDGLYDVLDLDVRGAAMQVGHPDEQAGDEAPASGSSTETTGAAGTASSTSSVSSRSKTPKKPTPTVIAGIGRPGAVKPVELKTSSTISTPSRSSSAKSPAVGTPGGKSDDSLDSTRTDDKSKGSRTTPQRARGDPATPVSVTATPTRTPTPQPRPRAASPAPTSASPAPPTVLEVVSKKKASPEKPTPIAVPVVQTPPPKASLPPPAPVSVGSAPAMQPTMSAILTGASSSAPATPAQSASSPVPATAPATTPVAATTPVKPPTPAPIVAPVADEPPPLTEEQKQILHMVDESFQFMPESRDSEKPNRYTPRNPYATPAAFPSTPSTLFDRPAVFEKLDVDTLFFIFYYQQGSYQQYLAARELKRRTWGYHKKYKTWFKRHEEPQITGDDYEQGTFVYFDYETGWCQRIKTEFMFEYSYLEDELQ